MRKHVLIAISASLLAIPLAGEDVGTDPPNASLSQPGGARGGSYSLSQIESVNPLNGNMSLRIPVPHLPPGPGGFTAGVDLVYNSTIFDVQTLVPNNNNGVLQTNYVPSAHGGGWHYGYKYTLWSQTRLTESTSARCGAVRGTIGIRRVCRRPMTRTASCGSSPHWTQAAGQPRVCVYGRQSVVRYLRFRRFYDPHADLLANLPNFSCVATETTDAASHVRINCPDGLGRLTAVLEPTGMSTSYAYDLLDNLTGVSAQCISGFTCTAGSANQTRTFIYSTL